MKYPAFLLLLYLLFICSCGSPNRKQVEIQNSSIDRIDSLMANEIIKYNVVDTVINDYSINHYTFDTTDSIPLNIVSEDNDTLLFASSNIVLCIKEQLDTIFYTEFSRYDFSEYIVDDEIQRYSLVGLWFVGMNENEFIFNTNLCIPDTDLCYDFNIIISLDGECIIRELQIPESEKDNNFGFDFYRYTRDYYSIYLRYPSKDELLNYCWDMTNIANGERFKNIEEFLSYGEDDDESFLLFYYRNFDNILFEENDGELYIHYEDGQTMHLNLGYCDVLEHNSPKLSLFCHACLFDSLGTIQRIGDADDDVLITLITHFQKSIDPLYEKKYQRMLLRYNLHSKYRVCCPIELDTIVTNESFKNLALSLDTFIINRGAETIQFIMTVPI